MLNLIRPFCSGRKHRKTRLSWLQRDQKRLAIESLENRQMFSVWGLVAIDVTEPIEAVTVAAPLVAIEETAPVEAITVTEASEAPEVTVIASQTPALGRPVSSSCHNILGMGLYLNTYEYYDGTFEHTFSKTCFGSSL